MTGEPANRPREARLAAVAAVTGLAAVAAVFLLAGLWNWPAAAEIGAHLGLTPLPDIGVLPAGRWLQQQFAALPPHAACRVVGPLLTLGWLAAALALAAAWLPAPATRRQRLVTGLALAAWLLSRLPSAPQGLYRGLDALPFTGQTLAAMLLLAALRLPVAGRWRHAAWPLIVITALAAGSLTWSGGVILTLLLALGTVRHWPAGGDLRRRWLAAAAIAGLAVTLGRLGMGPPTAVPALPAAARLATLAAGSWLLLAVGDAALWVGLLLLWQSWPAPAATPCPPRSWLTAVLFVLALWLGLFLTLRQQAPAPWRALTVLLPLLAAAAFWAARRFPAADRPAAVLAPALRNWLLLLFTVLLWVGRPAAVWPLARALPGAPSRYARHLARDAAIHELAGRASRLDIRALPAPPGLGVEPLTDDPGHPANRVWAHWYGLEAIRAIHPGE